MRQETHKILRLIRWLSVPLAIVLMGGAVWTFLHPPATPYWFFQLRGAVECLLAILLIAPFQKISPQANAWWWRSFAVLLLVSVSFVFLRVIGVLFEARALALEDERLGIPAWSGTLIFLVLIQLPVILFLRYPDELD